MAEEASFYRITGKTPAAGVAPTPLVGQGSSVKEEADSVRAEWEMREKHIASVEERVREEQKARKALTAQAQATLATRRQQDLHDEEQRAESRRQEPARLAEEVESERRTFQEEREKRLQQAKERDLELRRKQDERVAADKLRRQEEETRYQAEREARFKAQQEVAEKVQAAWEAAEKARTSFNSYYQAHGDRESEQPPAPRRPSTPTSDGEPTPRDRDTNNYRYSTQQQRGSTAGGSYARYSAGGYGSARAGSGGGYPSTSYSGYRPGGPSAGGYTSYTSSARQAAADYMTSLGRGGHVHSGFTLRRAEAHETMWKAFETKPKPVILYTDIPFPDANELAAIAHQLGGGKKAFQKLALRWHPDKFLQKYGKSLDSTDKKRVLEKVKEVFQNISTARDRS